jgi:hypothetical protein
LLREREVRFCVIGGQADNAYVEPLVGLDLDLAVAVAQIDSVRKLAKNRFHAGHPPGAAENNRAKDQMRLAGGK